MRGGGRSLWRSLEDATLGEGGGEERIAGEVCVDTEQQPPVL